MSERISVTLETNGNAAFEDSPATEIARILREAAKRIENGDFGSDGDGFRLNDINGNKCGRVTIERVDEEEEDEDE
jgi:hypothetical protein